MFGNLGAFVNGNMFMGLFGSQSACDCRRRIGDALLAMDGAGPFGPTGRPMGGYVSLPPGRGGSRRRRRLWTARRARLRRGAAAEGAQEVAAARIVALVP